MKKASLKTIVKYWTLLAKEFDLIQELRWVYSFLLTRIER